MRYRLRTLLIVLAVGPPLLAGAWPVLKPIADDYWLLQYGGDYALVERIIVVHSDPAKPPDSPLFHPIAEFLAWNLP